MRTSQKSQERTSIQVQEAFRKPNREDQKRTTLRQSIERTFNIQNKNRLLKAQERSSKSHMKANSSE
jgi:hypothetical protein